MRALPGDIEDVQALRRFGRLARIEGLPGDVTGVAGAASLGGLVRLTSSHGIQISREAAGFRDGRAFLAQKKGERATLAQGYSALDDIVGGKGKAP